MPKRSAVMAVRRSRDLLALADVSDRAKNELQQDWLGQNTRRFPTSDVVPVSVLQFVSPNDQEQGITYTERTMRDIESLMGAGNCPAGGPFLDSLFAQYVGVVFGPSVGRSQ